MPFCPKCRGEFQDWVKMCPDCQVDLVAEPPLAVHPETQDIDSLKPAPVRPFFDPPLYKRGNKRCPNCGQQQWTRFFGIMARFRGSDWECGRCGCHLTRDIRRHVAFYVACLVAAIVIVFACWLADVPDGVAYGLYFVLGMFLWWWFDHYRLKDTSKQE